MEILSTTEERDSCDKTIARSHSSPRPYGTWPPPLRRLVVLSQSRLSSEVTFNETLERFELMLQCGF
jgi:hypothetical protein